MWTLNSFAQMSSMLSLKKNVINAEIDPASAPIDNLGYACLDTTAPQAKL